MILRPCRPQATRKTPSNSASVGHPVRPTGPADEPLAHQRHGAIAVLPVPPPGETFFDRFGRAVALGRVTRARMPINKADRADRNRIPEKHEPPAGQLSRRPVMHFIKEGCDMEVAKPPKPYSDWRKGEIDREEDAAYTFGYHLISHCRDEAMETLPGDASAELRDVVKKAVDVALHNVNDMLEGFWRLEAGPAHSVELVLGVRVHDEAGEVVETLEISPCKLDLPIGYWKWANDREFQ